MSIEVEPVGGPELDRLITALLNATGVVHRAIESVREEPAADGVELIGIVAADLRSMLTLLAEHRGDDELALVTDVLAEVTLLAAAQLGLGDCFTG